MPDKIEAALDRAIERTNPGPPPRGEVWGALLFGGLVGALLTYWFVNRPPRYEFHVVSPGIIVRVEPRTGRVAWTLTDEKEPWHYQQNP